MAETPRPLRLTKRQIQVYTYLAEGLSNKEIARRLDRKAVTVSQHIQKGREALGAATREEALCIALEEGLIKPRRRSRDPRDDPHRGPCAGAHR